MFKRGFTIVELLIVIVVIGILAAVILISYIGITDSANNVSVQNDLEQSLKRAENYEIQNGMIPDVTNAAIISNIVVASRAAYSNSGVGNSYVICRSDADIAFLARSITEKTFYATKSRGTGTLASWPGDGNTSACPAVGISTGAPGYNFIWAHANNVWNGWVH